MGFNLFPMRSLSGHQEVALRHQAEARQMLAETRLATMISAYIVEAKHPDCLPEMRFRVTLPNGTMAYAATREEVEAKIMAVAGL